MSWAIHVACITAMRNAYERLRKPEGKDLPVDGRIIFILIRI
jgi:hypothetical protein